MNEWVCPCCNCWMDNGDGMCARCLTPMEKIYHAEPEKQKAEARGSSSAATHDSAGGATSPENVGDGVPPDGEGCRIVISKHGARIIPTQTQPVGDIEPSEPQHSNDSSPKSKTNTRKSGNRKTRNKN